MSWLSRLRNHLRGDALSNEIRREMQFHLAERADELIAAGMDPGTARREARRRFGSLAYQGERTRDRDLFRWLDILTADLRYAQRSLRAAPAFSVVAILSLALGIGANTAIFSIIDAVMLKSLPVSHPEQLLAVVRNDNEAIFTNPQWEAIRDRQDVFSGVLAFGETNFNLTAGGEARRIDGHWVSGDYFGTLGIRPAAGRLIAKSDDFRGCPGVAVLAHQFWQSEYGGNLAAVGQAISLDGHPFQIIGVADARFFGLTVGERPQVFVPLCTEAIIRGANSQLDHRSSWFLQIIGRPKPGLRPIQIAARFATLAPAILATTMPSDFSERARKFYREMVFRVVPAEKGGLSLLRISYGKALYVLMAIVGVVLMIACANVANLLLARATVRQREIAVRLALGAGRGRIIRQLVTESLLLSGVGAGLGIALSIWASRALVALLARTDGVVSLDLTLDIRVLLFTIGVAVVTGLLFGLAPAWRAGRISPQTAMKAQGRGIAEGHTRLSTGKLLVAAQISLSLVLIVGAGLLVGSWHRLATVDPGFRREHILLVNVDIRGTATPPERRSAFYEQLLNRIRSIADVRSASTSQITPIGRSNWNELVRVQGFSPKSEDDALSLANAVSDGYFATLGIPMLAGRDFDHRDTKTSRRVVIVNEALARKFFGTPDAVGRTLQKEEGAGWSPPIEVVGVVGNTKYQSLRDSAPPIMYFPATQEAATAQYTSFEARTGGPTTALVPAITRAFTALSPSITLDFKTLDQQLSESLTLMRAVALLAGFFGGLAVLLATIGLYGIMAYSVARRRNEIGVRIALGADGARIVGLVLSDVGRIVAGGVLFGLALSLAVMRLVASFLYGVAPNDTVTLLGSTLLLVSVGAVAAALPAWRAARLDPVAALRQE